MPPQLLHMLLGLGQQLLQALFPPKTARPRTHPHPHSVLAYPAHLHHFLVHQRGDHLRKQLIQRRSVIRAEVRQQAVIHPHPAAQPAKRRAVLRSAAPTPAPSRCPECRRTAITPPAVAGRSRPAPPPLPAPGWARRSATDPASPPPPSPAAPDASAPPDRPRTAPPWPFACVPASATAPRASFLLPLFHCRLGFAHAFTYILHPQAIPRKKSQALSEARPPSGVEGPLSSRRTSLPVRHRDQSRRFGGVVEGPASVTGRCDGSR